MRLIDADKLEKQLDNDKWMDNYDRDFIVGVALDEAPTVDAVEVVHGRWLEKPNNCGGSHTVCSECGACQTVIKAYRNYCGRCGAKMDGERRNDDA